MDTLLPETWLLILNPRAGNGLVMRRHQELAALLAQHGLRCETVISEAAGDPVRLARRGLELGYRKIAAVGGDGTLHQIVNGIFSMASVPTGEVTLGLIPVGTGNDWARDAGIPNDWPGAVALLAAGKTAWHDIGQIDGPGVAGDALPPRRVWFLNVAGIGFDAFVVQQLQRRRSSRLIYLWGAVSNLARFSPVPLTLAIDSVPQGSSNSFALFVALRRFCGQGMQVAPQAQPDDGLFDVTWVPDLSRGEVLWNLRRLYDGSLLSHPKVRNFRTARLSIAAPAGTPAEADGELIGHAASPAEISFQILPRALRVVIP